MISFFKRVKAVVVEYWEIFLAIAGLLTGVIIGTYGKREKVAQADAEARKKASEDIQSGTDIAIEEFHTARKEILDDKNSQEKEADKKEVERKEELLNNSSKLDKVLKEKYNLDGG